MKRHWGLLFALLVGLVPAVAFAGVAYIPHFSVNAPNQWTPYVISTGVMISNISTSAQTVTIAFYNVDGTPLANHPYTYRIGTNPPVFNPEYTNPNGEIVFELAGMTSASFSLQSDGNYHSGFGTITGVVNRSLVATVLVNTPDNTSFFSLPITIHGGDPF